MLGDGAVAAVLAEYAEADAVMRNFAVTLVRRAGFAGTRVAEVFGLSAAYVSTLHAAALREGSAALVKNPGPRSARDLGGKDLDQARESAGGRGQRPGDRRAAGDGGTTKPRRLGPRGREPAAPAESAGRQRAAGCEPLFSEDEACAAFLLLLLLLGRAVTSVAGSRGGARRMRRPAAVAGGPGGEVPPPGAGRCEGGAGWPGGPGAVAVRGRDAAVRVRRAGRCRDALMPRRPGTLPGRGCWRP